MPPVNLAPNPRVTYITAPNGTVYEVGSRLEAHKLQRHSDVNVTTPPLVGNCVLGWDPTQINPDGSVGGWHAITGTIPIAGGGISIGPDASGSSVITVNTGPGITKIPDVSGVNTDEITVNVGSATNVPLLPQALEITPYDGATGLGDILQIKRDGIKNDHIGAQFGSLIDVDMSVSNAAALLGGEVPVFEKATGLYKPGLVAKEVTVHDGSTGDLPVNAAVHQLWADTSQLLTVAAP